MYMYVLLLKAELVVLWSARPLKAEFFVTFQMNNSTTEHDTMKLITPFLSESTVHSNDINISHC